MKIFSPFDAMYIAYKFCKLNDVNETAVQVATDFPEAKYQIIIYYGDTRRDVSRYITCTVYEIKV